MGKNIITVTRQFGSLGRAIAKKAAKNLCFEYYDRDVIEKSAAAMGIPVIQFEEFGDRKLTLFDRMGYPLGLGNGVMQANIFEAEKKIICGMAEKGNCIIVGRCSDYILRTSGFERTDMLNLFFYAPYEQRFHNCINELGLDNKQAVEYLDKVDEARQRYYRQHTDVDFDSVVYRDYCIDTSTLPMDEMVDLICELAKRKFKMELSETTCFPDSKG